MQRLNDRKWCARSRRCAFLSLIPGFGHFGFVFMGKRSGHPRFRTLGLLYGIANALLQFLLVGGVTLDQCRYLFFDLGHRDIYYSLSRVMSDILGFTVAGLILVWIACMVHTLCLSGQYLRYLALRQTQEKPRNPLVFNKKFRRDNLWWLFLGFVPFCGGFAQWFAGRRMKRRGLTAGGVASVLVSLVFLAGMGYLENYSPHWESHVSLGLNLGGCWTVYLLGICGILTCWKNREDYLDFRAEQYQADIRENRLLADKHWRRHNSLWHIWTALPYAGGIGIAMAGLKSKRTKNVLLGVSMLLGNAAILIAHTVLVNWFNAHYDYYRQNAPLYALIGLISGMRLPLYILGIFAGMVIHWDSLKGRAAALQGYASEFDRDADLYLRMQARTVPAPAPIPAPVPTPVSDPIPQTAPVRPVEMPETQAEGTLDINRCTQSDYMTLPGFTVAMAHRAMEYRAEKGGFGSADEFVDVLGIKPHFAVQIFPRIAAEAPARTPAAPRESGPARRRIEF